MRLRIVYCEEKRAFFQKIQSNMVPIMLPIELKRHINTLTTNITQKCNDTRLWSTEDDAYGVA